MQETPANRIVPAVIAESKRGTEPRRLVAAAALANARTFGGEDYVGFHTMMALAPAFHMSCELPEARRPLPIVKVLYRNTNRIQESGGRSHEVLHPVAPARSHRASRQAKSSAITCAPRTWPPPSKHSPRWHAQGPEESFNDVLFAVQDNTEVHRTVLPYRAWDLLSVIGLEHAHTLLRQSVHYCVKSERELEAHAGVRQAPRPLAQAARSISSGRQAAGNSPGG